MQTQPDRMLAITLEAAQEAPPHEDSPPLTEDGSLRAEQMLETQGGQDGGRGPFAHQPES